MPRAAAVRVEAALAEVAELEATIRAAQARQFELIAEASEAFHLDDAVLAGLTTEDQCRFPHCSRPATRTDFDHTEGWADGGRTDAANLACLCRAHHRMKHHGGWRVRQLGRGRLEWTSPTGRVQVTEPEYAFMQGVGGAQGP
ncbi:HNH endonuclease signature motif containing protein [Agromyces intestinalis]|nr:HNH endonuclease signature motif containing protein [Agromyces intestinalis]